MAERNDALILDRGGVDMAAYSVPSDRHPERNEDAYFIDAENQALGVFDGVSGNQDYGSAHAAQLAAEATSQHLRDDRPQVSPTLSRLVVQGAIFAGHDAILQNSTGGATTAVAAKLFKDKSMIPYAVIASAGDSRPYRLRDGVLTHLAIDDTITTEHYQYNEAMSLQERMANIVALPEDDVELINAFQQRGMITSFLGMREYPPVVTVSDFEVRDGDKILLTSDGVSDNLTTDEITAITGARYSADTIVRMLVDAAQARSRDKTHLRAKPDDMTAALLVVQKTTNCP